VLIWQQKDGWKLDPTGARLLAWVSILGVVRLVPARARICCPKSSVMPDFRFRLGILLTVRGGMSFGLGWGAKDVCDDRDGYSVFGTV
jgi:hypothetical protein